MRAFGLVVTLIVMVLLFVDIEAFGSKLKKWRDSMN